MASFAANYSNRYRVRYRAAGRSHVMSFRYGITPGAPPTDLVIGVGNFLAALTDLVVADFAILSAGYIAAGSTFELPAVAPTGVSSGAGWTTGDSPRFYSFVGRGTTGQPATIYVYGAVSDPGNNSDGGAQDYRVLASEDTHIAAALAELAAITAITDIVGDAVLWRQYANVAYSAYYQRKARRG